MKILYVSGIRLSRSGGDSDHVLRLCQSLARLGHEVHLVAGSKPGFSPPWKEERGVPVLDLEETPDGFSFTLGLRRLGRRVLGKIQRGHSFDKVILRPFFLDHLFLGRILESRGIPYHCELNTMSDAENRSRGGKIRAFLSSWSERRTLRGAAGWMVMTAEIGRWAESFAGLRKPWGITGNGYAPEDMEAAGDPQILRRDLKVPASNKVLIMAGYAQPWHGADRAVEILSMLGGEYELWLPGEDGPVADSIKALSRARGVGNQVRIFPRKSKAEMAVLLGAADLGLAPLALDRISMAEAQTLKVRAYLGAGLPVLINHKDPAVGDGLPFVGHIKSTDPRVLAEGTRALLAKGGMKREEIKAYAKSHLTWDVVAGKTILFLEQGPPGGPVKSA